MKKIKIGVFGCNRGGSMISYCSVAENAEVVAICDKWEQGLEIQKKLNAGMNIAYYTSFEDFIKHDMDAVVLANYAHEHAPFAIRAMKEGKHVYSEVLPFQNIKEAVELVEAVEETGMIYAFGENYCFMKAPYEMRKLYREKKIGEIEYAEGEYIHNCESIWHSITYGDKNHWRNNMYSTFYCTHSLGPIIHITGLRPVAVSGFEGPMPDRHFRMGFKTASCGIEMVTLENGALVRSIHGGLYKDSIWYSIYGSKGTMESGREIAGHEGGGNIYINADKYSGEYGEPNIEFYEPKISADAEAFGHGGSDFIAMYNFVEKIRGKEDADIIDVYEACDMALPGILAYRSVLNKGIEIEVPDLRNKSIRDKYRNDTASTYKDVAGDMVWPTTKNGTPEYDDAVYEIIRKKWEAELAAEDNFNIKQMKAGRKQ